MAKSSFLALGLILCAISLPAHTREVHLAADHPSDTQPHPARNTPAAVGQAESPLTAVAVPKESEPLPDVQGKGHRFSTGAVPELHSTSGRFSTWLKQYGTQVSTRAHRSLQVLYCVWRP